METPASQQGGQGVAGEAEEDECTQGQPGAVQHAPTARGQQLLGLHLVGVGGSARSERKWPTEAATGKEGSALRQALLWDPHGCRPQCFCQMGGGLCEGAFPDLGLPGVRY